MIAWNFFCYLIIIIIIIFLIIFSLPLITVIAILIVIFDDFPIFFIQERIGLKGKKFRLFKFRTMYPNAQKKLKKLLEENKHLAKEWSKYRKLKHDPRITPLGRVLRKFSLDELPQIFNLIKGDIGLIGPRPYLPEEIKELQKKYGDKAVEELLSIKPGLTGLWQVKYRNKVSLYNRFRIDLFYLRKKNCLLDIIILFKTIESILKGSGV